MKPNFAILILSLLVINCKKLMLKVSPTVWMTSVTNITSVSASSGGTVTADEGATVTTRGSCWSATNKTPTTATSGGNIPTDGGFAVTASGVGVVIFFNINLFFIKYKFCKFIQV